MLRQSEQIMHRILNPVSGGLVLRNEIIRQRLQRRAGTPRSGDEFCSGKGFVHQCSPSSRPIRDCNISSAIQP
jgi:hypothetical protein